MIRTISVALVVAVLGLAGCNKAIRPQPIEGQEGLVEKLLEGCPEGIERLLPGDYYYCQGASRFWAGSFGMSRDSLESAAAWASKPAQQTLGIMYFNGDHAVMNRPLGVAWLALSAERHQPDYEQAFVAAYRSLSPEELAQANVYWKQMVPKYGDAYAAPRAERRYTREYRRMEDAINFGGLVYIAGVTGLPVHPVSIDKWMKGLHDDYFAGYQTRVWVGDAELVPVSELPAPSATPQGP